MTNRAEFLAEFMRHTLEAQAIADSSPPSFTCPRCGHTSHHPTDIANGYCGACHDWTGDDTR